MTKEAIKCVDFFCGGGGMSLGLSRAGIDVVGALDNDPDCRATYEANHPGSTFIQADITKAKMSILESELGIRKDDDNLLFVGCSPCQYWSIINGKTNSERKQKSHGSRNLLRYFLEFVRHYRPGYVLVENVRGIDKHRQESGLDDLTNFLYKKGYRWDDGVLEASRYGVPQSRRRYVLVASRVLPDIQLPEASKKISRVREYIGDLPAIKAGEVCRKDPLHRASGLSEKNLARVQMTPEGGLRDYWAKSNLIIPAYKGKDITFFRENYGRMAWDSPAPTITTKFFALSCGRFGHPEQHRAISLREGAMLQTFPKSYKFKTKSCQVTARLIGNAVPPKLAKRIGKSLIKQAANNGRHFQLK